MSIEIKEYTFGLIDDVLAFEKALREQEAHWGWSIDEAYISDVLNSFKDERFKHSVSLLACDGERVVGRIDTTLIASRFDGRVKAYLDWICVLKSYRHKGVAQALLEAAMQRLKAAGAVDLIAIAAQNDEAQRFYRAIPGALIKDEGVWISL